jgi:hypothetical protein
MLRFLDGRDVVLLIDLHDDDGGHPAATGPFDVDVVDGAGIPLDGSPYVAVPVVHGVSEGQGHGPGHSHEDLDEPTGTWQVTVPAGDLRGLDRYVASGAAELDDLSGSVPFRVEFDVAGGFLFEIRDLRAFDQTLEDVATYPAERLRHVRTDVEQRIENEAEVAFVPRGRRVDLDGSGEPLLLLPDVELRDLLEVTVDGVALDPADVVGHRYGALVHPTAVWPAGVGNVRLRYTHGYDAAPGPVSRAAMLLAGEALHAPAVSARATSLNTDVGAFRLSIAGRDGATGHPEVDAIIAQFGRRRPKVG